MTSEIRTNSIKSRTGLSTVSYADTGIIVSGIVTATSFVGALPISNDSNNRVITATGSGGLNGEANLTYDGTTLNIIDSASGSGSHRLTIGNSHDLRLYHDGNSNIGHYGAGDFYLTSNNSTDLYIRSADDLFLQPQDGENGIIVTGNGSVALFYDNVSMLETEARGAFVKKADGGETLFTIGSTNAGGVRLALDGDSNGDATGFDYAYLQHNSSGDLIISADNPAGNSNLIFQSGNSSEYLRIDSSGRILIGTTQYTTNKGVVIYGESGRGADVVFQNANTGTGTGNNGFYVGNGTGAASYVWNYENADLHFATNNTERLRITSNGDIGTNGITPTAQAGRVFHLHAGATQQRFHMTNNTTGSGATDGFEIIVEESADVRIRNFEAGDLMFNTGGTAASDERVRIERNSGIGKVIIQGQESGGTTYGLEIIGNQETNPVTNQAGARIIAPDSRRMYFELRANDDSDHFAWLGNPDYNTGNADTVMMKLSAKGRLTIPTQPRALVKIYSTTTLGNAKITNWASPIFNVGNLWNAANSRFIAPEDGLYLVGGNFRIGAPGKIRVVRFNLQAYNTSGGHMATYGGGFGGTHNYDGGSGGYDHPYVSFTNVIYLTTGQYLELHCSETAVEHTSYIQVSNEQSAMWCVLLQ